METEQISSDWNLRRLTAELGITSSAVYGRNDKTETSDWDRCATHWTVTLRFGRRRLTTGYSMGSAHTGEPEAADVLGSLALDATCGDQSFEDFCSEFGYDTDSRKAERTYKACARMAPKLRRFLGEHYDAVLAAEH